MIIPPDERHIESIESLLQIEQAIDAFYHFILESEDVPMLENGENHCLQLLSLYMDI